MKTIKKVLMGAVVLAALVGLGVQLQSMQLPEFTPKGRQQSGQSKAVSHKTEMVWMMTSDGIVIEMPRRYIDQMKVLQVMLVHQTGKNSKNNPINVYMLTNEQLTLLQMALKSATNLTKLQLFCDNLTSNEKRDLINGASVVEAQGLLSLLMNSMFPPEVQQKLGASILTQEGIIAPVVGYLQEKLTQETRKKALSGHTSLVTCVAYSPNGHYIVSGSNDMTLILWNAHTGEQIKVFEGHTVGVKCVAYSPDGQYIVSGADDNNLILWDVETGKPVKIFKGHKAHVTCVAYSPDGNYIVSGAEDKNLILWDVAVGDQIRIFEGHVDMVSCVAYSPDGSYIVSGSQDKHLILWDAKNGDQIKVLEGHGDNVKCVMYSPHGEYIVSGSWDNILIMWNGKTGDRIEIFKRFKYNMVNCMAYSPDGQHIIVGLQQGILIVLDSRTGKQIRDLKGHRSGVTCVAYSPDGKHIVSGSRDGALFLWSLFDETVDFIARNLDIAQARLLYRLYIAKINNVPVILDMQELDYQIYLTLPEDVQNMIKEFFPFEER